MTTAQPLDPSKEYLAPSDLDEGDLIALRHRLENLRELAKACSKIRTDPLDFTTEGYLGDVEFHQTYYADREQPHFDEQLIVVVKRAPQNAKHAVLSIRVADQPGHRAIEISEPIMLDRSNCLNRDATASDICRVIDRWIDLTHRPIFTAPSGAWARLSSNDENSLIHQARATEAELRALTSALVHTCEDPLYNLLSPATHYTFGGAYSLPELIFDFAPDTDEGHLHQALTPEAACAFAKHFPGIVGLKQRYAPQGVSYTLSAWQSREFYINSPEALLDQMRRLASMPDGPLLRTSPIQFQNSV